MLQEIVGAAQNVSKIVAEIAAATREQNAGIGEVNSAIAKIEEMTGQNAALVQQDAASATALLTQANALNDAMDKYQISDAPAAGAARPDAAAPPRRQASR
jgi:methyl-accepting chemotaxis protein